MQEIKEVPSVYVGTEEPKASTTHEVRPRFQRQKGGPRLGWTDAPQPDAVDPDTNKTSVNASIDVSLSTGVLEDHRSTDDSSSQTSSLKLRRQNDMSTQFRQRIRQQAKQMVEKKRGSAQLAKRLSRSHSSQQQYNGSQLSSDLVGSSFDGTGNPSALDQQIEESILLGSKYTHRKHATLASEELQRFFFFGKTVSEDNDLIYDRNHHRNLHEKSDMKCLPSIDNGVVNLESSIVTASSKEIDVVHAKPRFSPKANLEKFAGLLRIFGKQNGGIFRDEFLINNFNGKFEDQFFRMGPSWFSAKPFRDYSVLIQRVGDAFLTDSGRNILGLQNLVTDKPEKIEENNDENAFYLLEFNKAEEWNQAVKRRVGNRRIGFDGLEVDINRIEFEHHWLYSREESIAKQLCSSYEIYSKVLDSLFVSIQKYSQMKQEEEDNLIAENANERDSTEMSELLRQISKQKIEFFKLGASLELKWRKLQRIREATKYSTTNLALQRIQPETFSISQNNCDIPKHFEEILSSPIYFLNEVLSPADNRPTKISLDRLEAAKKCRIQIQVFFNDVVVCTTSDVPLQVDTNGGFVARFGRILNLQVLEDYTAVCLKIRERFNNKFYELAKIYLPICNDSDSIDSVDRNYTDKNVDKNNKNSNNQRSSTTSGGGKLSQQDDGLHAKTDAMSLSSLEFASDLKKASYKDSMGSGGGKPFINGKIYYTVKWQNSQLKPNGDKARRDKSKDLRSGQQKINASNSLTLIPNAVTLVSEEEFQSELGRRFAQQNQQLLPPFGFSRQFSLKGGSGFAGSGASGSDLFADDFGGMFPSSSSMTQVSMGAGEWSLDAYRRIGHSYAVLIRRHLAENFALEQRLKTYSEIVHEESLPTLFRTFGTLFTPPDLSRKLKPMRLPSVSRNQQAFRNTYKLIVNVQSASNLPQPISKKPAFVFVEASFQKSIARTSVVSGCNANWQETLILEISKSTADNSIIQNYKDVLDSLEVNIFDQIVTPLIYDDREPNTFHEQVEYRWLGSVSIPFRTIYTLGRIDGTLTLQSPLFLSGYEAVDLERHSTIKMLVTIDPPLAAPRFQSNENFSSGEIDEKLFMRCKKWEHRLHNLFPERRFLAFANDSNGKQICASRFLRKIAPPQKILEYAAQNAKKAVLSCVDLVASIPFINDPIIYPGVCDIWANADELLKIGCGDIEEHAILLTCWLLGMDISAFLLLGHGYPEGPRAAYVLVEFDSFRDKSDSRWLINPYNGFCYAIDDPTIPFQVGTALTPFNAYGNICRSSTHPSLIDFDFKKRSCWEPLFNLDRLDLVSVQVGSIRYVSTSEDLLMELRANLEREIKFHFDEARPYGIPQWNLLASRTLRDILNDSWQEYTDDTNPLAFRQQSGRERRRSEMLDIESKLESLRASYNVQALAFRCTYTSRRELLERVLRLRAHINSNLNVQFALAVNVQPFINQIVCVSIAIAALAPLNNSTTTTTMANWN